MSNPGDDSEFNQNNEKPARACTPHARSGWREKDILVNHAGRYFGKPWGDTTPDKCNSILNANVAPLVGMSRRLAIPMRKAKWGP
jgi:NADP-dependent 3-hydroxy acid dehydrogenase YdfG